MMITSIRCSLDLAVVLNATPATEADAAETPRDWLAGIWVDGETYPLDPDATTETRAVLANGTAAVRFSPQGEFCLAGGHDTTPSAENAHWCPADTDWWDEEDAVRGVERDWRMLHLWDSNGFSEVEVYPTLEEAHAAFTRERGELEEIGNQYRADNPHGYPA